MTKKLTDAEKAFRAAVVEIERVRKAGGTRLVLSGEKYLALEEIPAEVTRIAGLRTLDLEHTRITDLAPLAALTGLQMLELDQTGVTDLAPLASMIGLEQLFLSQTSVADLAPLITLTSLRELGLNQTGVTGRAPLAALTRLQILGLNQTGVNDLTPLTALTWLLRLGLRDTGVSDLGSLAALTSLKRLDLTQSGVIDLRPICNLPLSGEGILTGLSFLGTPATALDATLAQLSAIEDDARRTTETLAYLKTLPPWPAPLPWLVNAVDPDIPQGHPAPLQVVEVDGVLRRAEVGDALADPARSHARQGWAALRDFLDDLSDLRPRIVNQMPNLARALRRFETAMGTGYDQSQPIALGTHGQLVIRLASAAGESLADADQAVLQEFAAALALFLERFPEWRAYRTSHLDEVIPADRILAANAEIRTIETALTASDGIDPEVPLVLHDLGAAVEDVPLDAVVAHGLLDSVGNVLSALGTVLLRAAKATGGGLKFFVKTLGEKAAERVAATIVSSPILLAAYDLFLNKAQALTALATAFPEKFGWLLAFLMAFGS